MNAVDERILTLPDLLKKNGTIRFLKEFYEPLGMERQNIHSIKKGLQHFTVRHIEIICSTFDVNANFLFGLEGNPFRKLSGTLPAKRHDIKISAKQ